MSCLLIFKICFISKIVNIMVENIINYDLLLWWYLETISRSKTIAESKTTKSLHLPKAQLYYTET